MASAAKQNGNPDVWAKVIKVAIAILTALLGFFTGTGVKAATSVWFNM